MTAWPRWRGASSPKRRRALRSPASRWAATSRSRSCGRRPSVSRAWRCSTPRRARTPRKPAPRDALQMDLAVSGRFAEVVDALFARLVHPSRREDAALRELMRLMVAEVGVDGYLQAADRQHRRAATHARRWRPSAARRWCWSVTAIELTPPERAAEIADGIPGARLVVVPDCGHLSTLERPAGGYGCAARMAAELKPSALVVAQDAQRSVLLAHPDSACRGGCSHPVEARLAAPAQLGCHYALHGDIGRVRLPDSPRGRRARTGCGGTPASRSSWRRRWPATTNSTFHPRSTGRRITSRITAAGMTPARLAQPPAPARAAAAPRGLELVSDAAILRDWRIWPRAPRLQLALAAVVEDEDGRLSYWALRHAPGKPDFHHPRWVYAGAARPVKTRHRPPARGARAAPRPRRAARGAPGAPGLRHARSHALARCAGRAARAAPERRARSAARPARATSRTT